MRKIVKILSVLLCLVICVGLFASVTSAADAYKKVAIKSAQLTVGHYTNAELTGSLVRHCANPNYDYEVTCLIDKDKASAYWSKPYKFDDLKDGVNETNLVPAILINLTTDGKPTNVAAFEAYLRSYLDCQPLHVEIQVATDPEGTNWVSVFEQDDIKWSKRWIRFDFPDGNVAAYQLRFLVYDISDANTAKEDGYGGYQVPLGDETRFALAEIALYDLPEGSTPPPATEPPTQKPTDPVTTDPNAPTDDPAATDPSAPTDDPAVTDPSAPTDDPVATDPSTPTDDPETTDPTKPTDAPKPTDPVEKPSDPSETTADPKHTTDGSDVPSDEPGGMNPIVIVLIVVVALAAVAGVILVIKKKKQ